AWPASDPGDLRPRLSRHRRRHPAVHIILCGDQSHRRFALRRDRSAHPAGSAAMSSLEIAPEQEQSEFRRRFLHNRHAVIGGALAAIAVLTALFATSLAPHSYTETNMLLVWGEPDTQYPLGLDSLARASLTRILVGARVSL